MSQSPDFLEAPAARRWKGSLELLLKTVRTEALQDLETWSWRILPRGALVSYMVRKGFRHQLRIARRSQERFTELQLDRWEREVAVFLEKFGVEELDGETRPCDNPPHQVWRVTRVEVEGGQNAQFAFLRLGEVRLGLALCGLCGCEVQWWPMGGVQGQRCNSCVHKTIHTGTGVQG